MRVYLSVPIIANRSLESACTIADIILRSGCELSSPWVIDPEEIHSADDSNIFQRDINAVVTCDAIVAEVSSPSIGGGMEVMTAYLENVKIILVSKKGAVVTKMLTGLDRATHIQFEDEHILDTRLGKVLRDILGAKKEEPLQVQSSLQ